MSTIRFIADDPKMLHSMMMPEVVSASVGGSGRFLVNEVRGWFLSDEPLRTSSPPGPARGPLARVTLLLYTRSAAPRPAAPPV